MVGKIVDKELELRKRIREYCDTRDICCGVDDRKIISEGIVDYIFWQYGGRGLKMTIKLTHCSISEETVNRIYECLDNHFSSNSVPEIQRVTVMDCGGRYDAVKNKIAEYKWRSKYNIEKVIFNNPATIVFWEDGTKTVVKRQKGDRWDREKGIAMAIAKKLYGNTGKYYDILKEHLED